MISLMTVRPRFILLASAAAAALLALAACGGGGSSGERAPSESLAAGQVTCEQLFNDSYQYRVQVDQDIGPLPTAEPTPTGQGRPPFHVTAKIEGKVQDGVKLQATIDNTVDQINTVYEAIQIGANIGYVKYQDQEFWTASDTSIRRIPFPYWPMSLCDAFSPGIDTTALGTAESDTLNGVSTEKYQLTNLSNTFFARSPDFGSGSDASAYTGSLTGTLWVSSKGRYPVKFDISGQGLYPSGQVYSVQVQYEVWDMGSNISISEPPLGTP